MRTGLFFASKIFTKLKFNGFNSWRNLTIVLIVLFIVELLVVFIQKITIIMQKNCIETCMEIIIDQGLDNYNLRNEVIGLQGEIQKAKDNTLSDNGTDSKESVSE